MGADDLLGAEPVLDGHHGAVAETPFQLRGCCLDVVRLGSDDHEPGIRQSGRIDGRAWHTDKVGPAGDADPVLGHRGGVLSAPAEQRHFGDAREVGGEEAADDAASDDPDAVAQGVRPLRIVASFAGSMFPPETTQTTLPEPPFSASAAASAKAPAPSATTLFRSTS